MIDYYLRFPDEATANSVLMDGDTLRYSNTDVIGVIYDQNGVELKGWHVNIRTNEDDKKLEKYKIEVNTPIRIWG